MNDPSGSQWRKWDLHVHTPASLFHRYEGTAEKAWEAFLQDIESLPPEFKVIGVNDYIFVDGYSRLRKEKEHGRLPNIALLLPVIELRLDKFGGSPSHLSKVNFHIIFSDEVDPQIIKDQFLNGLWTKYELTPPFTSLQRTWKAHPTLDSIEELGRLIIESVPEKERSRFASPLMEGFNNLTFRQERIEEALDKPYFQEKYLLAVGKAEWANIKWTDNSIADKKNIINSVDFVFTASAQPEDVAKGSRLLREGGVNDRLLDCSDAHSLSTSPEKDRIGNCFTWIKADLTFEGLKHALLEFGDRVFIGDEPQKLKAVRDGRTFYIKSIIYRKAEGSGLEEDWFSGETPFNHGLVAIIGNKGSGKSALADTIGLLGNSPQSNSFSFLNETKFRDPKINRARHFEAAITWESGAGKFRSLDSAISAQDVELVKYIPQNFLETICNEIGAVEETTFDSELKKVIFSHVQHQDRLGQDSLDSLLVYKTTEAFEAIRALRIELEKLDAQIDHLEGKLTPTYREGVQNALSVKLEELKAHEGNKPAPEDPPPNDMELDPKTLALMTELESAKKMRDALLEETEQLRKQRAVSTRLGNLVERVSARLQNFRKSFDTLQKESALDLEELGLPFNSIVQVTINTTILEERRSQFQSLKGDADRKLDQNVEGSLPNEISTLERKIEGLQSRLDEPGQRYQRYLHDMEAWNRAQEKLNGDVETPGTIFYLKNLLDNIDSVPDELEQVIHSRQEKTREIFGQISGLCDTYRDLYSAVKNFIQNHPIAKDLLQLNFEVSIENTGFEDRFFDYVSHAVTGSFCGVQEGRAALRNILKKYDFNSWDRLSGFLAEVVDHLHFDKRFPDEHPLRVRDQLRKGYTVTALYDYIFSLGYLRPRYTLRMGDKELAQLSPGERGALLLIFYLLVDKGQIPLLIDQPEENLDNQTIYNQLVPCLREAKKNRQVIIVTHNPNLAVVADAEQIIHAALDKANKNTITYTSGALENPTINRKVLDVLEGTRPAFDNRSNKYQDDFG